MTRKVAVSFYPADLGDERITHRHSRKAWQQQRRNERASKVIVDPASETVIPLNIEGLINSQVWERGIN